MFTRPQQINIAITTLIIALCAITLHLMGRVWMDPSGFGLWTISAWSTETSQNLGDPYTFSHILHGIIFFAILWLFRNKFSLRTRFYIALFIEIAWEILENSPFIIERYRANTASLDYFGDSILNATGDLLSQMFGFWMAYKLPWKWTLAFVVAVELILLYLIRDNLTLNIIMLLFPIDALREWQMAH